MKSDGAPRQLGRLWARDPSMLSVLDRLLEIAHSDAAVLIEGETGTGKELVAEAIHERSRRKSEPYMVVDCAAVPGELIESELFGHMKGAFTGAVQDRIGAFEAGNRGTVFIDEIGELPLNLQPKLLRVLEKQEVKRVGSSRSFNVDVRILSATNRNLEKEVAAGRFREDVYFRLNVLKLRIPPLRERPLDIILIAERMLESLPTPDGRPLELKEETRRRLLEYRWPGNVRELRNIIDRGAAMSDRYFRLPDDFGRPMPTLEARPLPDLAGSRETAVAEAPNTGEGGAGSLTRPLWNGRTYKDARDAVLADFEQGYVSSLLEAHGGNVSAAARAAGIHRNILHRMMARYGIGR